MQHFVNFYCVDDCVEFAEDVFLKQEGDFMKDVIYDGKLYTCWLYHHVLSTFLPKLPFAFLARNDASVSGCIQVLIVS